MFTENESPHESLKYIPEAQVALERDWERVNAERAAFKRFGDRVDSLHPVHGPEPTADQADYCATTLLKHADASQLETLRSAYREMVMSVPHFESEYDESLETHMQAEFEPDIVTAVASDQPLTRPLKTAIVEASRQAATRRRDLQTCLEREATALQEVADSLDRLAEKRARCTIPSENRIRFETLATLWEELRTIEFEYAQLCSDRQAHIRRNSPDLADVGNAHHFHQYLYRSLDVTYPALADIAWQLRRTRDSRRHIYSKLPRPDS